MMIDDRDDKKRKAPRVGKPKRDRSTSPVPERSVQVSAADALDFEPQVKVKPRIPATAWMLIVLLSVTSAGLVGFLFGDQMVDAPTEEAGLPIVRADIAAIKVRPENPGGRQIPDRDKTVYNRLQGEGAPTRVEQILPPPEQPLVPPRDASAPEPSTGAPGSPTAPTALQPENRQNAVEQAERLIARTPPPPPDAPRPAETNLGQTLQPVPRAVITPPEPKTPDLKTPEPQADSSTTSAPPVSLAPPQARAPLKTEKSEPVAASNVAPNPAPSAPETAALPSVTKRATTPPPAAPQTTAVSGWQVQLAASRSSQAAQAEGVRLQKKFSSEVGTLTLNVVRADLGERGVFYRIRLGPFATRDAARATCAQLKAKNQGCLVVAPK